MVSTTNGVGLRAGSRLLTMAPMTRLSPAASMQYSKMMNSAMLKAASGPRMCLAWAYCPPAEATVELTSESIMATQE